MREKNYFNFSVSTNSFLIKTNLIIQDKLQSLLLYFKVTFPADLKNEQKNLPLEEWLIWILKTMNISDDYFIPQNWMIYSLNSKMN